MTKTITLSNPITTVRKIFAKRQIAKLQKQINKKSEKIQKLESKFFDSKIESDKVPETTTEKITRMTEKEVKAQYGNKIIFKRNTANKRYHAEKGNIDNPEFMAYANMTKWLNVSPNPKKPTENRVFFNYEKPNGLFVNQAKKAGFEVVFN